MATTLLSLVRESCTQEFAGQHGNRVTKCRGLLIFSGLVYSGVRSALMTVLYWLGASLHGQVRRTGLLDAVSGDKAGYGVLTVLTRTSTAPYYNHPRVISKSQRVRLRDEDWETRPLYPQ